MPLSKEDQTKVENFYKTTASVAGANSINSLHTRDHLDTIAKLERTLSGGGDVTSTVPSSIGTAAGGTAADMAKRLAELKATSLFLSGSKNRTENFGKPQSGGKRRRKSRRKSRRNLNKKSANCSCHCHSKRRSRNKKKKTNHKKRRVNHKKKKTQKRR